MGKSQGKKVVASSGQEKCHTSSYMKRGGELQDKTLRPIEPTHLLFSKKIAVCCAWGCCEGVFRLILRIDARSSGKKCSHRDNWKFHSLLLALVLATSFHVLFSSRSRLAERSAVHPRKCNGRGARSSNTMGIAASAKELKTHRHVLSISCTGTSWLCLAPAGLQGTCCRWQQWTLMKNAGCQGCWRAAVGILLKVKSSFHTGSSQGKFSISCEGIELIVGLCWGCIFSEKVILW